MKEMHSTGYHCFAEENYGKSTMYNSNMVLYFVDNYIRSGGQLPDKMMYPDLDVDYEVVKGYIRIMKNHSHGA